MKARLLSLALALLGLSACSTAVPAAEFAPPADVQIQAPAEIPEPEVSENAEKPEVQPELPERPPAEEEAVLYITIGDETLSATWEDNSSAEEFQALLAQGPVTIEMEDYGGFEKVGPLGADLPRNDIQITTEPGDVILYQGNQVTIYYGTNTWSFTRLAKIDDPTDLAEKLGDGAVAVTFSLEQEE